MRSMARWLTTCAVVAAFVGSASGLPTIRAQSAPPWLPLEVVTQAGSTRGADARAALDRLAGQWRLGYAPILLELAEQSRAPLAAGIDFSEGIVSGVTGPADAPFQGLPNLNVGKGRRPVTAVRDRLLRFLERTTGQRIGLDLNKWHQWTRAQSYDPHPEYVPFKS